MAAIHNLLERLGFVKLNRYGLVLTPDGRILSMRPAVLDDGMGGRIVGWQDADLAAAELGRWEAVKPLASPVARMPPPAPMAARTVSPMPPPIPRTVTAQVPIVPPPAPIVASPMPSPMPQVASTAPVAVAPKAEEPEDDWEWTIALARARAAADEVMAAAPPPMPKIVAAKTVVAAPAYVPPQLLPRPAVTPPRAASPSPRTIIPVPKLASVRSTPQAVAPLASRSAVIPLSSARRTARGTVPPMEDTRPMIELGDETNTRIDLELPDQTRPNFVMPSVARAR